jgi:hypothetical protein
MNNILNKQIGFIMVVLLLVACSDNDTEKKTDVGNTPIYDLSKVEVSDMGYVSVTDFYSNIVKKATEGNSDRNQILLEYAQKQLNLVKEKEQFLNDSLNNVHGTNGEAYGENWDHKGGKNSIMWFQYCTLRYKAKGVNGKDEELSELVIWPYGNVWDPQPDHVIVGCHCTVLSNAERPTNFEDFDVDTDLFMLASFAHSFSQEALVVIPDYEGYGATHGNTHPYIDREVLAQQVVEGTKAAIAWYQNKFKDGLAENWKSVAIGYSQGGSVAAGVLRYCQEHNENSLRMAGAVCGGGCYSPESTLKSYIDNGRIYMPIALALMIKSCLDTQPELKNVHLEDVCTQEFINTGIFQWIKEKKYITEDIQDMLLLHSMEKGGFLMYCWSKDEDKFLPYDADHKMNGKKLRKWNHEYGAATSYCTPEAVLKPEVIEFFKNGLTANSPSFLMDLRTVLQRNSLYYRWLPSTDSGFIFFHSTKDEVVPHVNMTEVDEMWTSTPLPFCRLDYENNSTYLHVGSGTAFYVKYCGDLVDDILYGNWACGHRTISGGIGG